MSDEGIRILDMFKQGRISYEETMELLYALNDAGHLEDDNDGSCCDECEAELNNSKMYEKCISTESDMNMKEYAGFEGDIVNGTLTVKGSSKFPGIVDVESLVIKGAGEFHGEVRSEDISIPGKGMFYGDVEAENIDISGTGVFYSHTSVETINVNGSTRFDAGLECEEMEVKGNADVQGELDADELQNFGVLCADSIQTDEIVNNGKLQVKGDINADTVDTKGVLLIEGDLNADTLEATGELHIKGEANLDEITIETDKLCSIGSLRCDNARIKYWKHSSNPSDMDGREAKIFEADCVEGEEIYLEYSKVKQVKGENIKIGPGCEIDRAEYCESFEADSRSTVRERVRV